MKYSIFLAFLLAFSCNRNTHTNTVSNNWESIDVLSLADLGLRSNNEDISALKTIVRSANVVCLGESRHDISEQFKLKSKLVKYLVEELGFRVFALEASLPYSVRLNDYLNTGNGSLDLLMAEMPGWFLWDTQELKELLAWIREFNAGTDNKVVFYGFDIVAPNDGFEQIFDYLESVDEASHKKMSNEDFGRDVITDRDWSSTLQEFASLSEERTLTIRQNVSTLYETISRKERDYISKSSDEEYQWISKVAYSAREAISMFSVTDRMQMGLIREGAMANICSWIVDQKGKTVIWAHNVHIAKSEFTMSMFPDQTIKGMGALLAELYDENLISIAGTFGRGEFQSEGRRFPMPEETTIDGAMSRLGIDNFIIDLRQATKSPKLETWLKSEITMKGQDFEMSCVPIEAFDAVYYTNNISKVQYSEATLNKMGNSEID